MSPVAPVDLTITLDCADPRALAPFWAAALHYEEAGAVHNYTLLVPGSGSGPKMLLQLVPEARSGKNRMHLDIHVPDIEAEVARLEQLGARRLDPQPRHEHDSTWILMADPEGNEFCVCDGGSGAC